MSTPDLYLQTGYVLDGNGRITEKRSPEPEPGSLFSLIRGTERCVWAVRADVPQGIADEIDVLAREEPPVSDFRDAPVHAERYMSLLESQVYSGPAFTFPKAIARPSGTVLIDDLRSLERHFTGWKAGEIPGASPVVAVVEEGYAVSVCFCARRSAAGAEAGLETAAAFRGSGLGPRVTAAWALAIRASGRIPLYSTSWSNHASLAVARKLGLLAFASVWSLSSTDP